LGDTRPLVAADANPIAAILCFKHFGGSEKMNKNYLSLILLLVAAFFLSACSDDEPTPDLTATAQPPEAADAWERIREAGKIVVGTSADYPPFEFYAPGFNFDGMDMVLIREFGARRGLDVEIHDFAFEGLGDALSLGQIDVAIAGLSVTPERLGKFDFSDIYFVSEDAVLAREDNNFSVANVEDLALYRVGVQSGSVYQSWLEENLVDTDLLPPENLSVYVDTQTMVSDLDDGFVDLLVVDKQPAEAVVMEGPFEIVASGFSPQLFAIAMPQGASTLQAELNSTLTDMKEDGTLAKFIRLYTGIDLEEIVPPDLELPEPEPQPPQACIDGMAFLADLNLDHKNMTDPPAVDAGQPFQKGWRIENVGTCQWDGNYQLVYVDGNVPAAQMGGQPTPIQGTVVPGGGYDMWVDLVAPAVPGTYQGIWQMVNDQGVPFGQRISVGIIVPPPATPTPVPTQTPSPDFQFTASPNAIQQGQCATLTWSSSNVSAVYVYEQGQPWQDYGVDGSGQRTVCPATTTTYEMRVVKPDNSVEVRQVTVFVTPVTGAPVITRFTVSPNQIFEGQCLNVQWIVDGTVSSVRIIRDLTIIVDQGPLTGSTNDCPPGSGEMAYSIEATGPGGTSRQVQYVQVTASSSPPPQATPTSPASQPPVINYFSVSPSQIQVNQCVNIAWSVGGSTSRVQIKRDNLTILDNAPFQGNTNDCPTTAGSVTYQVIASSNTGNQSGAAQTIIVGGSTPENPLANTNWQATTVNGRVVSGTTITAFFSANGTVSGSGGCNNYNAFYVVDENSLIISGLTFTGNQCGGNIDPQEQSYLSSLVAAASYQISGNELVLLNELGQEVIRYQRL
jgi:polar amino acid transport system substrate-binding protein